MSITDIGKALKDNLDPEDLDVLIALLDTE
jgi:hypothetical protein